MALLHVTFFSETLGMYRNMDVIIPQKKGGIGLTGEGGFVDGDIPTLYLLHGGTDDHTIWQRYTAIERYAMNKGLAVVMPSTDMGCYTDMAYGYDFFSFYGEELPVLLRQFFPCLTTKREKTFVAGQSMGGYGALKLGTVYPERFSHVAALSALVRPEALFDGIIPQGAMQDYSVNIFGKRGEIDGTVNDLYADVRNMIRTASEMPKFLIVCGSEDFLYPYSREFYEAFKDELDITSHWPAGGHQWELWEHQISDMLTWMLPEEKEG